MKLKINTKIIKELNPCQDRLDNWLKYYSDFKGDILDFLELENITAQDKVWVSLKLLPREIVEVFSIDCAFSAAADAAAYAADAADAAAAYAAAAYAADAAAAGYAAYAADAAAASYAAADAADYAYAAAGYADADAAAYAAARLQERENQVDALIMLIKGD